MTVPPEGPSVVVFRRACPECGGDSKFVGHFSMTCGTLYDVFCPSCDAPPVTKALARIPRFA